MLRVKSRTSIARQARHLGGGDLALQLWRCARLLSILASGCENVSFALADERVAPMRSFLLQALRRCARVSLDARSSMGPLLLQALRLLTKVALTFRESVGFSASLRPLEELSSWDPVSDPVPDTKPPVLPPRASSEDDDAGSVHSFNVAQDVSGEAPAPSRPVDEAAWEHGVAQLLSDFA
jgi:hypothetical protein